MNDKYLDKNGNPLVGITRFLREMRLKQCYNDTKNYVKSHQYPNTNANPLFTIIPQYLFTEITN